MTGCSQSCRRLITYKLSQAIIASVDKELSRPDDMKAIVNRVEDLLERIRMELHRDVVERVFYLEGELLSLRRELRRLGDAIDSLLSWLQGNLTSSMARRSLSEGIAFRAPLIGPEPRVEAASSEEGELRQGGKRARRAKEGVTTTREIRLAAKEDILRYISVEASDTELKILRLLYEDPEYGKKGSTEIAKAIGRVREHTARMLKKLCELGLLMRNEDRIPYSYYLPKEVAEVLKLYLESKESKITT